jgi:hypothetical protein
MLLTPETPSLTSDTDERQTGSQGLDGYRESPIEQPGKLAPSHIPELTILETAMLYGFRQLPDDAARMQYFDAIEKAVVRAAAAHHNEQGR